ncbi:hypothetical protein KSP40_PGU015515 [Platanthera guangdongensis]|uniref:Uncharacterized protein n=1 Tax=Platanthera guangdongensis TaxID=2320717 RepID=A0ABR2LLP7_9ASPA
MDGALESNADQGREGFRSRRNVEHCESGGPGPFLQTNSLKPSPFESSGPMVLLNLVCKRVFPTKVDNRDSLEPWVTPKQAMKICNCNFGVSVDGVIFAMPGLNDTDYSIYEDLQLRWQ